MKSQNCKIPIYENRGEKLFFGTKIQMRHFSFHFQTLCITFCDVFQGLIKLQNCISESAEILLQRGLKRIEEDKDQWEFTRDLKHRVGSLYGYPQEVIKHLGTQVKCPHLVIKAQNGRLYETEENVQEMLEVYKTTNPQFKLVHVPGNHHVHLNSSEVVWPEIQAFLQDL